MVRNKIENLLKKLPEELQSEVIQFAESCFIGAITVRSEREYVRCAHSSASGTAVIQDPPIMSE
jgi:hypothetical protein